MQFGDRRNVRRPHPANTRRFPRSPLLWTNYVSQPAAVRQVLDAKSKQKHQSNQSAVASVSCRLSEVRYYCARAAFPTDDCWRMRLRIWPHEGVGKIAADEQSQDGLAVLASLRGARLSIAAALSRDPTPVTSGARRPIT